MRTLLRTIPLTIIILNLVAVTSCDQSLEEEVFNEIASTNFFRNDADAISAVNGIYAKLRGANMPVTDDGEGWGLFAYGISIYDYSEVVTDETFTTWAKLFPDGDAAQVENFTLTANESIWANPFFRDFYEGINIANNVIENVENNELISESIRNRVVGEALFGRALFYYHALSFYGNIPLILEINPDPFFLPEQASGEEVATAITDDLSRAADLLPVSYSSRDFGRFTKGAALALLARFYLNQKMWPESVQTAQEVIGMYSLSGNYADIFSPNNTQNPEIIFSILSIPLNGLGNTFAASAAEPDQLEAAWGGTRIRDSFYNTFDPADIRRELLQKSYTTLDGEQKSVDDGAIILKYSFDDNTVGAWAGNDIVVLRYAEVLLTLAEALNEINGPNQETIDLINQLRERAFPGDQSKLLQLQNFSSKEQLRAHILEERGWELYAEGYRREDLIRHGVFVEKAIERGYAHVRDHHQLYPIPQVELDKNPNLVQNPGY